MRFQRCNLLEEIGEIQFFGKTSGQEKEEIIAAAYDKAGFDDVILAPRPGDYGTDIIAIKKGFGSVRFIEQVKAYSARSYSKSR